MAFYWGSGVHWWTWGLGIGLMLVFWALVIWAIVALVRWAHGGHRGPGGPGGPGGPDAPPGPWPPDGPRQAVAPDKRAPGYPAGPIDTDGHHRRSDMLPSGSFAGSGSRS